MSKNKQELVKNIINFGFIDIFSNEDIRQPEDYKIHCFNGKAKYLEIQFDRFKSNLTGFYNHLKWV
ncbi:hypothetical protein KC999_16590 [Proteus mirabilis]|uniref:ATP-grasp fold amidoligase family protein n=1 Tax=Morganellaceae TaxID=1903414 RepID=UPI00146D2E54|nr:hypothetical protein [Proteus mirabilis]NMT49434.1 hypothetical protein [Providencia stuartii]